LNILYSASRIASERKEMKGLPRQHAGINEL